MTLDAKRVKAMTLKEFNLMLTGWNLRNDETWDKVRTIMADIRGSAFGAKKAPKPTQILKIRSIDESIGEKIKHITTKRAALELLKTF